MQKILKVAHLLNFAMTRMLKTDLQKKLRSITKRITNEGYIIFVFPIIIAQTYVRLSLEHADVKYFVRKR